MIRRILSLALLTLIPMLATAQPSRRDALRTEPARPYIWRTRYLEIIGADTAGVVDHGSIHARLVERRMLVVNRSPDSLRLELHGCCGHDYFGLERGRLAPGDTDRLTIGFLVEHSRGRHAWSTRLDVIPRSGEARYREGATFADTASEHLTFISRMNILKDVTIDQNYLVVDSIGARGVERYVDVIASSERAITLRAEPRNDGLVNVRPLDTNRHHLAAGDTLRIRVHIGLKNGVSLPDHPSAIGGFRIVTSSEETPTFDVSIYLGPSGKN